MRLATVDVKREIDECLGRPERVRQAADRQSGVGGTARGRRGSPPYAVEAMGARVRRRPKKYAAPGTLVTAPSTPVRLTSAVAAVERALPDGHSWLSDPPETLQPQDLAITIVGANGRTAEHPIWSGGMVRLLGEFGFSTGAARVALGRLARSGLLRRAKQGRHVFYELTPQLEHLLAEGDRHIFGLGVVDEETTDWTVVWQAVPDELAVQRTRLVRRLRFLGFGPVQNGTWVAPHDRAQELATVLTDLGIQEHVGVIVGHPATADALRTLMNQAWDLDVLAERYLRFLDEVGRYRSARLRARLSDRDAFLVRVHVVHRFRRFPFYDPGVPEELLERRTPRREAVELFHRVYDSLAEPAQRYFDAVMREAGPRVVAADAVAGAPD